MKNQSTQGKKKNGHGGKRAGAGRPKGALDKVTKEKKAQERLFKMRVLKNVYKLVNAQLSLAQGISFLFKIQYERDEDGKLRKVGNGKPVLVTDPEEIKAYLDREEGSGEKIDSDDYYYITTQRPDNKAIDSMLDRVFGKAQQHVDLTSKGENLTVVFGVGRSPFINPKDGNPDKGD